MKCPSLAVLVLLPASLTTAILCQGATPTAHAPQRDTSAAAEAPPSTVSPARQLPRLAVTVSAEKSDAKNRENLEDLLTVELGNQRFLTLMDRQNLQAILREHAIALSNVKDTASAVALGKFAGADYLLHVLLAGKKFSIRLVETATGQVKSEGDVALYEDLTLSAAAVREKVLAALRPESQASNRLTVGVAAFLNRSGTDRSDALCVKLQKALRKRLQERPWAVVLERQYPTSLLDEVDLARLGLVRQPAVERLPPADLVILGTLQDVGREYEKGKPWNIKLDLTLGLRGQSDHAGEEFRSDAVELAADEIMRKIETLRRRPIPAVPVAEKELWRRQALYLMPIQIETWLSQDRRMWQNRVLIPNFEWSSKLNQTEVVRCWENVLLLDDRDADAMNHLGAYLISVNRGPTAWTAAEKQAAAERCIAGSRLVERALGIQPSRERAASYVFCLRPLLDMAPARAAEMGQYILNHRALFKESPDEPWVKVAQTMPVEAADDRYRAKLDLALSRAAVDPDAVLILCPPGLTRDRPAKPYRELLERYIDSGDPVVQFVVHRALGELLSWQERDRTGLQHFDHAIAAMEAAWARCKDGHRDSLTGIYQMKIEACQFLGDGEEAGRTALAGAKHFQAVRRFDRSVARLYGYCVTKALGPGQEKQSLAICDAYMASLKPGQRYYDEWFHLSAKREELLARLAGNPVPGMDGLRFVKGTKSIGLRQTRMAATKRKLWFTSSECIGGLEQAMVYEYGGDEVSPLQEPGRVGSVAAWNDSVFFGGLQGLCKIAADGTLVKQYNRDKTSFPGYLVKDVCEGGGRVYFAFLGSSQGGIAVLDPATDRVSVLAPSSHEATGDTEPVFNTTRLWWEAASPRLYACNYFRWDNELPLLSRLYGWSPRDNAWRRRPTKDAPRFVLSGLDETLVVRITGDQTEFHFAKAGQTVRAGVPVPMMIGEPAWNRQRIWVPTSSGLYEVDRATGRMTWLAYEDGNWFLSLLKAGNVLYVATSRGLYYRDIPLCEGN